MSKYLYITMLNFLCISVCHGQFDVSGGINVAYPVLSIPSHTAISAGQISSGFRAAITYTPEFTQFFPALNISYGRIRLPLQVSGRNVAALNFSYTGVMLNENYVIHFPQSRLLIFGGLGISLLKERSVATSSAGAQYSNASIDSVADITKVFPAVNLGLEYTYGDISDANYYLSAGVNLQCILLAPGRNTYYLDVAQQGNTTQHYESSLTGNMLNPGVYVALHFKLHKK